MTNPFSNDALVPNWTKASEILKGDVKGHVFHGNQWSVGVIAGATHAGASREQTNLTVNEMSNKIGTLRRRMLHQGTKINDLNRLSLLHSTLAGIHTDRGDDKAAELHLHASDVAHKAYIKALSENNGDGKVYLPRLSDIPSAAHHASNDALAASFDSVTE